MPNKKTSSDRRHRISVDLLGLRERIDALKNHPSLSFFREMKLSGVIRHLITKGLEYYESQVSPKLSPEPPIATLVQDLLVEEESPISAWEIQAISQGIRPSDEQLIYLATLLIKPDGSHWTTQSLMAIRDRDFPPEPPKPNGKTEQTNGASH